MRRRNRACERRVGWESLANLGSAPIIASLEMLHDAPIRLKVGDLPRRWIADDFFDLIVWYDGDQRVHGFQLCYDKEGHERALTWIRRKGFQHSRVDSGDNLPTENRAPVLISGGAFPSALVIAEFRRRSVTLSPELRRFVLSKLAEYNAGSTSLIRTFLVAFVVGILLAASIGWYSGKTTRE